MIPGGFRKEIVPAGFSAEAQSKVVMTEKTEFSATVCTAVVQLDHGIPVWSLVRRGDSRRAAIDFAYLSYKWGTAHYREISAELIFCNPRSPPAALVRIEVWSRWVRFPKLCLWPEVADFTLSSRDFPNEIFGFGQFALFAKPPLLLSSHTKCSGAARGAIVNNNNQQQG
jgi:hypothetical protein